MVYSFVNNFSYKNFGLDLLFDGVGGNKVFAAYRVETEGMLSPNNATTEVLHRWEKPGDVTNVPKAVFGDPAPANSVPNSSISSRFIESGAFFRLKAATLSYRLETEGFKRAGIYGIRFYVTGQNLFTVTKYKGYNPEVKPAGHQQHRTGYRLWHLSAVEDLHSRLKPGTLTLKGQIMRNNNRIFSFLLITGALVVTTACNKTLDKTPISTISSSNFWKTAKDAESGLTGAYNSLYQQYYIWDYMTNGDAQSDNCYAGGNNPDNFAIDNFSLNALNGNVTRDWTGLYDGVANANSVIDNVPAINDIAWSGNTRKKQIIGEAKFLRALHYFNLVTTYGKVPLALTNNVTVTSSAVDLPRAEVSVVYAQIEQDLLAADTSLLPASSSNPNNGRALKGSADALLAKVYAQQGKYDSCIIWCDSVLSNSYYSLLPTYGDLFNGTNKNTVESLFEIQHGTASGTTNYGPSLLLLFRLQMIPTPSSMSLPTT